MKKYHGGNLIPALRLFVEARNRAVEIGFTDNGGAIHSVERILDILGLHLRYPHLSHINNIKKDPRAEISQAAFRDRCLGKPLYIEHVLPRRAFAQKIIELVNAGATDDELVSYIKRKFRLVILTRDETIRLNRLNRSRITEDRIADAGIALQEIERDGAEDNLSKSFS